MTVVIVLAALFFGFASGMVAYSKAPTNAAFIVFFIFGLLLGPIGLLVAIFTKRAPEVTPAGWYPDPYRQSAQRYWDGTAWSGHTA